MSPDFIVFIIHVMYVFSGVMCNGRVRCPWHGACFNVKTGDIEEFPGLDSVPTYKVKVKLLSETVLEIASLYRF